MMFKVEGKLLPLTMIGGILVVSVFHVVVEHMFANQIQLLSHVYYSICLCLLVCLKTVYFSVKGSFYCVRTIFLFFRMSTILSEVCD